MSLLEYMKKVCQEKMIEGTAIYPAIIGMLHHGLLFMDSMGCWIVPSGCHPSCTGSM